MSTWVDRHRGDEGFTLLEVVVALVIFGLAAAALVPMMVMGSKAARLAQLNTVAKDLAQERIDGMRNLPYHVDRQNGPFIDMLDQYYRNLVTTPTTLPNGATGTWVANGSGAGGTPTGPYYEVDFPVGYHSAYPTFSQRVYTQFLQPNKLPVTPLPATAFSGYDSQTVGQDQPPSLIVGVTVITSWTSYGTSHSFRIYTQVTDDGGDEVRISSDAHAVALRVMSMAPGGGRLDAEAGVVDAAGRLSTGSSATVNAEGAFVVAADGSRKDGYQASAISPPNPAGSTTTSPAAPTQSIGSTGTCGWAAFGPTTVSDVSSTTAGGLPLAPTDVAAGKSLQASLNANGSTGSCAGFQFSNEVDGAPATDPGLHLPAGAPMVLVKDESGSAPIVTGSASVSATASAGAPGAVAGGAGASFVRLVQLFPGVIPADQADDTTCTYNGVSVWCGGGVVNVMLGSATLSCASGSATATAHVRGYLTYLTTAGWHTVDLDWDSTTPAADPLASIDLSQLVPTAAGVTVPLSSYVTSWSTARSVAEGAGDGMHTIEAAVALGTAPTRGSGDPASTIGIEVGHLACAAADNR